MQATIDRVLENIELLERATAARLSRDPSQMAEVYARTISWHVPGYSRVSGNYRGFQDVLMHLAAVDELTNGTMEIHPVTTMASDDYACQWRRMTGRRGVRKLDMLEVVVCRIESGRIAEVWERPEQYPYDTFFS
jgi:ketosteroid isomerase-like protein